MPSLLSPGSSTFSQLASAEGFVDKSSALKEFCYHNDPVHLILRPRRSGKTALITMFQAFFGMAKSDEMEKNKALFVRNNLSIIHDEVFDKEFAQYPVIYLDLSNVHGSTMDKLRDQFTATFLRICRALETSGLFDNRGRLSAGTSRYLAQILDSTLPAFEWPTALSNLTEILYEMTGRRVILLVDEYDTPISYAVRHGYFSEANEFFRTVFSSLLKNNRCLRGALLVGILRVAQAGWLSGLNNLSVFPLGEDGYETACMFTLDETKHLYNAGNVMPNKAGEIHPLPFSFDDLGKWYSGYFAFGGHQLYNPWAVGCAIMNRRLGAYWTASGYDDIIETHILRLLKDNVSFRENVASLLVFKPITIEVEDEMSYKSVPNLSTCQLWTLLYYAGYVSQVPTDTKIKYLDHGLGTLSGDDNDDETDNEDDAGTDDDRMSEVERSATYVKVSIPNAEIRSLFLKWIRKQIDVSMTKKLRSETTELFQIMISGSMETFASKFGTLVMTEVPGQFLGSKEVVYQAYVCAFFTAAASAIGVDPKWEVDAERYSGAGRLDLIITRMGYQTAAIHEHKRIMPQKQKKGKAYGDWHCKQLTKKADEALEQIVERLYRGRLQDHITEVHEYGVAFLGPYCAVVGQSLERPQGGQWVVKQKYTSSQDEARRNKMYTSA